MPSQPRPRRAAAHTPCHAAHRLARCCPTACSPRPSSNGHVTGAPAETMKQRPSRSAPPAGRSSPPAAALPQRPPEAVLRQRPCISGPRATTLQQRPCNSGTPAAALLVTIYSKHQCAQGLRGIQIRLTTHVHGLYFKQAIKVRRAYVVTRSLYDPSGFW